MSRKNQAGTKKSEDVVHQNIGKSLKKVYADILVEPVPDKFLDLLDKLDSENTSENQKISPSQERGSEKDSK